MKLKRTKDKGGREYLVFEAQGRAKATVSIGRRLMRVEGDLAFTSRRGPSKHGEELIIEFRNVDLKGESVAKTDNNAGIYDKPKIEIYLPLQYGLYYLKDVFHVFTLEDFGNVVLRGDKQSEIGT